MLYKNKGSQGGLIHSEIKPVRRRISSCLRLWTGWWEWRGENGPAASSACPFHGSTARQEEPESVSCSGTVLLKTNGNAMGNAVQMCSSGPVPHHLGSHTAQETQICLKKGAKPRWKFIELFSPLAPNLKQLWAQEIPPLNQSTLYFIASSVPLSCLHWPLKHSTSQPGTASIGLQDKSKSQPSLAR